MKRKSAHIFLAVITTVIMVAAFTPGAHTCIDAKFIWEPYTPSAGDVVTYNASISTCNWEGDNITGHYVPLVSYEWNFGDGTTGEGKITTHTYAEQGTYTVTLVIKDVAGANDTWTIQLPVESDSSSDEDSDGFPWWIAVVVVAAGTGVALTVYFMKVKKPKQ